MLLRSLSPITAPDTTRKLIKANFIFHYVVLHHNDTSYNMLQPYFRHVIGYFLWVSISRTSFYSSPFSQFYNKCTYVFSCNAYLIISIC